MEGPPFAGILGQIRTYSSPDDLKLKAANVRVLVIHQAEEAAKGLERIQRALEGELPNIADGIMNLTQFTRTFLAPELRSLSEVLDETDLC